MIPKACKRLAEVDFPIVDVSRNASREKATPPGHPARLHLWWARRPLASSRALLLGLLLPDPCDPLCPPTFKSEARKALADVVGSLGRTDLDLRKGLLRFLADFSDWERASHRAFLDAGRGLVRAAHPEESPLVVDPFAGGGSIPFEALRVGAEAFASDLNPVAVLNLKALLEEIPRGDRELARSLRSLGDEIGQEASSALATIYPPDPDGARPIAYLWSRTVRCEAPNCGAEIPVFKSPWLSVRGATSARFFREKDSGASVALLLESSRVGGPARFRIARGDSSEEPREGFVELRVSKAKGNNANVVCLCCGTLLSGRKQNPRTSAQLASQKGGADVQFDSTGRRVGGATLLAVVAQRPGEPGRHFRLPTDLDYAAVFQAQNLLSQTLTDWEQAGSPQPCPIPDEPLPPIGTLGFRVQRYGVLQWGDLFTARQKYVLAWLAARIERDQSESCATLLACALSRVAMSGMSCTRWNAVAEKMQHTFGRQAIPIVWDFAEVVVTAEAPGNWRSGYDLIAEVIEASRCARVGQVELADATQHPLPDHAASVWFTDPPYYDAVPYADLSDFFLVWLKRALPRNERLRDPFDAENPLSPKRQEAVQDSTKFVAGVPKDRRWFETTMARAFAEGRRVLRDDGIGAVVFAHKTTEGWEALLTGLVRGGWTITGSWPIATEMGSRLRARDSAALATSVHLVCRPRDDGEVVGDWATVLQELPRRVGDWMERLQGEGIRGADLVFACIGPALEVFSRYKRVETADGKEIHLADYLAKVWEVVGRTALSQVLGTAEAKARNGAAGAVEEDARLTALFLWTLQATENPEAGIAGDAAGDPEEGAAGDDDEGADQPTRNAPGFSLGFDVVRRFAQPLGIDLPKWEGRIVELKKGIVRLIPISERALRLFGADGAAEIANRIESSKDLNTNPLQGLLFPDADARAGNSEFMTGDRRRGASRDTRLPVLSAGSEATTLDRLHAAMLLQSSGKTGALRTLLKAEQERGPDFLRLANALTALYPSGSEERRLLEALLLGVPK